MQTFEETVKTQEGGEYTFEMPLPETIDEAKEVYGAENALWLLNSGLKTKLQHCAREAFRQGKDRAQAEESVRNYRPGSAGGKKGIRQRALELVMEKADDIKNDPELKTQAMDAFQNGRYREVVQLLETDED